MSFSTFDQIYDVTASLLPPHMNSRAARSMVRAICLQESRLEHRRQIGGPARGFPQFELGGGVRGVLRHPASAPHIKRVLDALCYDYEPLTSYTAMEHNDVLALAYARLLLWTLPQALPEQHEVEIGWGQYMDAWKPGKPHRPTWNAFYEQAWKLTKEAT